MKKALRNSWQPPVMFLAMGLVPAGWLYFFAHQPLHDVWKEGLADGGLVCLGCFVIIQLIRSYPTKVGMITYALAAGATVGWVIGWSNILLLRMSASGNKFFEDQWLNNTGTLRYVFAIALLLCYAVVIAAGRRVGELEERFRRQQDAESLLKEAELLKLRQQLQPHFLFNSLNSIASLILTSPDRAQDMTGQLAHFLRLSIRQEGREAVPVAEELAYLEAYLSIESVRFGDRLVIDIRKSGVDDMRMPSHLLQPLVENAVKYGLQCEGRNIMVSIHFSGAGAMLNIVITNPCNPLAMPQKGTGFGLEGVRRRLYLLYARTDLIETISEDNQFTTTLKIPQVHVSLPYY